MCNIISKTVYGLWKVRCLTLVLEGRNYRLFAQNISTSWNGKSVLCLKRLNILGKKENKSLKKIHSTPTSQSMRLEQLLKDWVSARTYITHGFSDGELNDFLRGFRFRNLELARLRRLNINFCVPGIVSKLPVELYVS